MPQYAVLIYADDSRHAPTATEAELRECDEHFESLVATGRMKLAYALLPREHARTLRAEGASEGPYHSTGHVVAGFYVLEADSLEGAIHLARKDPSLLTGGGIEVRPVHSGGVIETP